MLSVSLLVIYVLAREETIALLVDTCGELFLPQQSDIGVSQIMSRYNSVSLSYTAVPGLLFFFVVVVKHAVNVKYLECMWSVHAVLSNFPCVLCSRARKLARITLLALRIDGCFHCSSSYVSFKECMRTRRGQVSSVLGEKTISFLL